MGGAVMYMLLLLAQVVVLIYLGAFAAHCFLVVVENTAAGNDRVRWPDEPIYDWLWKPPYLVWLVAFWLVPAYLVLRAVKPAFLRESPGLQFLAVALPALWLLFPVSLMSSLSA